MSAESSTARIFLSIAFSPAATRPPAAASTYGRANGRDRTRWPGAGKGLYHRRRERSMVRAEPGSVGASGPGATGQPHPESAADGARRAHGPKGCSPHVVFGVREVLAGEEEAHPFVQGMPEKGIERPIPVEAQRVEVVVVLRGAEARLNAEREPLGVVVADLRAALALRRLGHALAHQRGIGRGQYLGVEERDPRGQDQAGTEARFPIDFHALRADLAQVLP